MQLTGKFYVFPKTFKTGSKYLVTSISRKEKDGTYNNMTIDINFSSEVLSAENALKMDEKYCYLVEATDGFLTFRTYTNKEGKTIYTPVIYIMKGKFTEKKEIKKVETNSPF